jgi:DNA-directed RNA polymerase specialized sigma24 family protein
MSGSSNLEKAMSMAKRVAREYYRGHNQTYLTEEDMRQEAMVGYLKGQNMKCAIIDAYRKASPLSHRDYKKGVQLPIFVDIDPDQLPDPRHTMQSAENWADLATIRKNVLSDREWDIFLLRCMGFTFDEIGERYDRTGKRIQQIFSTSLRKMRDYVRDND